MFAQRILATAFEPFGSETLNPTMQILEHLQAPPGATLERLVLPVVFGRSRQLLEEAIDTFEPHIVLGLGQAGGRALVSLERVALNLDDARIPDNAGQQPIDTAIIEGGPAAYFSTLPLKRMLRSLLAVGIPAHISQSAGTYVCNHAMYSALHALAARHPEARGGFIHVPFLPEQAAKHGAPSLGLDLLVRAVQCSLEVALDTSPDVIMTAGTMH